MDILPPVANVFIGVDDHGLAARQIDLVLGAVIFVSGNAVSLCALFAIQIVDEHGAAVFKCCVRIHRLSVVDQDIPHGDELGVQLAVGTVDLRHDVVTFIGRLIDPVAVEVILRTGIRSFGRFQGHGIGVIRQIHEGHRGDLVVVAGFRQVIHDHPLVVVAAVGNRGIYSAGLAIGAGVHIHAGAGEGKAHIFTRLHFLDGITALLFVSRIADIIAVGRIIQGLMRIVSVKVILKINVVGRDEVHPQPLIIVLRILAEHVEGVHTLPVLLSRLIGDAGAAPIHGHIHGTVEQFLVERSNIVLRGNSTQVRRHMENLTEAPVPGIHRHRCGIVQGVALLEKGHSGLGELPHPCIIVIHAGVGAVGKDLFAGERAALDLYAGDSDDQLLALGIVVHIHHIVVLIGEAGDGNRVTDDCNFCVFELHGSLPLPLLVHCSVILGGLHGDAALVIALRQRELALVHDVLQNGGRIQRYAGSAYALGDLLKNIQQLICTVGRLVIPLVATCTKVNIKPVEPNICGCTRIVTGHGMHIFIHVGSIFCRCIRIRALCHADGINRCAAILDALCLLNRINSGNCIKINNSIRIRLAVREEHDHLIPVGAAGFQCFGCLFHALIGISRAPFPQTIDIAHQGSLVFRRSLCQVADNFRAVRKCNDRDPMFLVRFCTLNIFPDGLVDHRLCSCFQGIYLGDVLLTGDGHI